ncbi:MAG: DUF6188 family protein [Acidimicrobiales bacterium]
MPAFGAPWVIEALPTVVPDPSIGSPLRPAVGQKARTHMGQYVLVPEPPYIYDSEVKARLGAKNQAGDARALRIPKSDLTFIRIDHQTRLRFDDTEVVIESPFVLHVGEATYNLDPGERAALGPVLALYPDTLEHAAVDDSATLMLWFTSGASITVKQDDQYEAWQVNGPSNYLVVCTPGNDGQLAVWE